MRVGFVTIAVGSEYTRLVRPGIESAEAYCQRHGYDLINNVDDVIDKSRPINWTKIKLLEKAMDGEYDWLFWCDSDTIIADQAMPLDGLMDGYHNNGTNVLFTRDPRGSINTGIFFIRNSEWSKAFLKAVYDYDCPHDTLWREQLAICLMYGRNDLDLESNSRIEERTWRFNAYPAEKNILQNRGVPNIGLYHQGDFLIHFAGLFGSELETSIENFQRGCSEAQIRRSDYTPDELSVLFMHRGEKRDPGYVPDEVFCKID